MKILINLLAISIFACSTIVAENNSRGLHERALVLLSIAEKSIGSEQYQRAKEVLYELTRWNLDSTQVLFRLGVYLIKIGEFNKSATVFKRILKRDPNNTSVLYNLGYALKNEGRNDEAITLYQKVLAGEPNNDGTHLALGYALLNKGDFAQGWLQHEHYLKRSGKYAPELRKLLVHDSLIGKRILLTPEGGLGDTINFIQCAQLLKERGATVIASVQKPLEKVLQKCTFVDTVITSIPASLTYDARVTYMSLPAALYLDEETMPKKTPYVSADQELVSWWKEKINTTAQQPTSTLKIGICWQADLFHDESRLPVARRSIPLCTLAQIAAVPSVQLYSLQTHEHNDACHAPEINEAIKTFDYAIDTDHGPFMDTAALIMNMDLVVTVDTATAHLAAALGKPTWLLLPYATDWRWIAHRTDSPWHPTMRIFKQHTPFDWTSVIKEITQELSDINN